MISKQEEWQKNSWPGSKNPTNLGHEENEKKRKEKKGLPFLNLTVAKVMSTLIAQLFKRSNQRAQFLDRAGECLCGLESGGGCLVNRNGTIGDIRKQMEKPHVVVM